jgi:hypothetical protein
MQLDDEGFISFSEAKVKLNPYKPRPFKSVEYMTDEEIRAGAGGTLVYDTENYINYFLIAFKCIKTGKYIRLELPFNVYKLSWILHNYTVVGFNSIKYDLPLIWCSYKYQELGKLFRLSQDLIFNGLPPYHAQKEYDFQIFKTSNIDLIEVCPLKGSLKLYAARLHVKRLQDLPFDINKCLTDEQKEITAQYCFSDLDATEIIFKFNSERFKLRQEMSEEYHVNLMSKSDAQIAEAVIGHEIRAISGKKIEKSNIQPGDSFTYDVPSYIQYATPELQNLFKKVKQSKFVVNNFGNLDTPPQLEKCLVNVGTLTVKFGIGGLHSCEERTAYVSNDEYQLIDRDVTSYYPEIILTQKLYPEHLGPIFLDVFGSLKSRRVEAKKKKIFAKDKGLKIVINGTSGKFNSIHSILYSPKCYFQMTLTGQLAILMLAEMLVCNGIKVISANTDGIVIYCKKTDLDKMHYWIDYWEKITGFGTEETRYKCYYGRDVNAYFAVKENDEVKVKGPYSEVGSQSGTQLDCNPENLICSDALKLFLSKGTPYEETILNCKDLTRFVTVRNVKGGAHKNVDYLGKVVRWYYAKGEVGTINYILTGNKVPNTEGAKPVMDMPDEFPNDVNYDWYINECKSILEDIGYSPRKEQLKLF